MAYEGGDNLWHCMQPPTFIFIIMKKKIFNLCPVQLNQKKYKPYNKELETQLDK